MYPLPVTLSSYLMPCILLTKRAAFEIRPKPRRIQSRRIPSASEVLAETRPHSMFGRKLPASEILVKADHI